LAQLVGSTGSVVGVDMTDEQLAIAEKYRTHHAEVFGFDNVQFMHGYIERLEDLNLEAGSFDVIVSNCVVNLSPDKDAVMRGVHRLLKPGGEFFFSDVYADRRVPTAVRNDPVLYGECLGGALYWNDFVRLSHQHGFADPRLTTDRPLEITDPVLAARAGNLRFYSATYRLFKIAELETACEDYGQAVIYKGTIPEHPDKYALDKHHDMETGRVFPVCGNTWRMLQDTRFVAHFEFIGNFDRHYGIFTGCGTSIPYDTNISGNAASCC
jgi:arsenite methyltransferase